MSQCFQTTNPFNNEVLKTYSYIGKDEVQVKFEKSYQAFKSWRLNTVGNRAGEVKKVLLAFNKNKEKLAKMATLEMGKLYKESLAEVNKCATLMEFYSAESSKFLKPESIATDGIKNEIHYRPLGPILGIMPWNFPYWQIMRFAIPTLLAGNSVLIKPAVETPECALLLEQIFHDAGVSKDLFQVVLCEHKDAAFLMEDLRLGGVAFTGSVQGGTAVYTSAAKNLKKTVLELGGSDPFIVMPDAELEKVVDAAISGRFLNCGQTCIASKRFYLPNSLHDNFIKAVSGQDINGSIYFKSIKNIEILRKKRSCII